MQQLSGNWPRSQRLRETMPGSTTPGIKGHSWGTTFGHASKEATHRASRTISDDPRNSAEALTWATFCQWRSCEFQSDTTGNDPRT